MNLTTHAELRKKWMRDEVYREVYEAELEREDACTSAEAINETKSDQEDR